MEDECSVLELKTSRRIRRGRRRRAEDRRSRERNKQQMGEGEEEEALVFKMIMPLLVTTTLS